MCRCSLIFSIKRLPIVALPSTIFYSSIMPKQSRKLTKSSFTPFASSPNRLTYETKSSCNVHWSNTVRGSIPGGASFDKRTLRCLSLPCFTNKPTTETVKQVINGTITANVSMPTKKSKNERLSDAIVSAFLHAKAIEEYNSK